jgi:hypothetical protein
MTHLKPFVISNLQPQSITCGHGQNHNLCPVPATMCLLSLLWLLARRFRYGFCPCNVVGWVAFSSVRPGFCGQRYGSMPAAMFTCFQPVVMLSLPSGQCWYLLAMRPCGPRGSRGWPALLLPCPESRHGVEAGNGTHAFAAAGNATARGPSPIGPLVVLLGSKWYIPTGQTWRSYELLIHSLIIPI